MGSSSQNQATVRKAARSQTLTSFTFLAPQANPTAKAMKSADVSARLRKKGTRHGAIASRDETRSIRISRQRSGTKENQARSRGGTPA